MTGTSGKSRSLESDAWECSPRYRPPGAAVTLTRVVVRDGAPASARISLQVPAGQSVALRSPSDTTAVDVLDVVAGLRRSRSGQVVVDGVAVQRLSGSVLERYRADRGLLSARFPLLPSLSVIGNMLAASRSRRADALARERATGLLALTGTAHLTETPVEALTDEQHWRILVARALVSSPRLVLAEDPTRAMAPRSAAGVLDLLAEVHGRYGFTLLLATDRVSTAARCQRLVTLTGGVVEADEPTGDDDPWTRSRVDRIG